MTKMPPKPVTVFASLMLAWIFMGLIWHNRSVQAGRQNFSFQGSELIEVIILIALTIFALLILFRKKTGEKKLRMDLRREKFRKIGEAIKDMREIRKMSQEFLSKGFRINTEEIEEELERAGEMLDAAGTTGGPSDQLELDEAYEKISQVEEITAKTREKLLGPARMKNRNDLQFPMIDSRIERLAEDLREGLKDLSALRNETPSRAAITTLEFNRVASLMGKIVDRRTLAGEQNSMEVQQFGWAEETIASIFEMLEKFDRIVNMPRQVLAKIEIAKNQFPRLLGSISFIMENLKKRDEEYQNINAAVEEGKSLISAASGSDWLTGYRVLLASYEQLIEIAREEGMEVEEIPNLEKIDQLAH